jgi:hypothetical protein
MQTQTVRLIGQAGQVLATAQVADEGAHYGGTIDLRQTPPKVRALFDEFEEIVNGQMFSFLDEVQGRIGLLDIKASFDDGEEVEIKDLQVFPSTCDLSFKLMALPQLKQRTGPQQAGARVNWWSSPANTSILPPEFAGYSRDFRPSAREPSNRELEYTEV